VAYFEFMAGKHIDIFLVGVGGQLDENGLITGTGAAPCMKSYADRVVPLIDH
jgi:hypothetical protein